MGKAIIGRKLGMTQLFDQESGIVTAVTVIEAGPCPVVQVRTPDVDGYSALQLAFGEIKERKLSKPEVGHLKHAGVARTATWSSSATPRASPSARRSPSRHSSRATRSRSAAAVKGKGFAGTIKRHNFAAAPRATARTTCASRARSVPRPRLRASSRACAWPATWATERVTQRGLKVAEVDAERNLLLIAGAVPGSVGGIVEVRTRRLMAALSAPTLSGATAKAKLSGESSAWSATIRCCTRW